MTPADESWSVTKFGIGQPVLRSEDPALVRGRRPLHRRCQHLRAGACGDGAQPPRPRRHPQYRRRGGEGDAGRARRLYRRRPHAAGYGTLKCIVPFKNRDGSEMKKPPRHALATDKVRYVGDPVAFVVAETLLQAKDAAEAVEVEIEPLPAVINPEDAVRDGAPQLYDDVPNNIALDWHYGDADAVNAAFANAAHVTKLKIVNSRVVVNAMEPRAAVASFLNGRFTLHSCSQGVFGMRGNIAALLNVEPKQVRVVTGNVGGSFGMKAAPYPEYVCILHAARALGRPVKWTDERSGSFVSDSHGRDHRVEAELALDAEGKFPGGAADELRQHGRLPRQCRADALDPERGQERAERLPHALDRGLDQMRVHQHLACLRLPRRRSARGQLLHGAADRYRRGRDGDRPAGAAPAQPYPPARDAAQDRLRLDL